MTDRASRLAEIEARHKAATPGEWSVLDVVQPNVYGHRVVHQQGDAELGNWMMAERIRRIDDADFIAHARQDVPWMQAEIVRFECAYNQTVSELTQIIEVGDEEQRRLQAELSSSDIRLKEMAGLLREAAEKVAKWPCDQCPGDCAGANPPIVWCPVRECNELSARLRNAADQAQHKELTS